MRSRTRSDCGGVAVGGGYLTKAGCLGGRLHDDRGDASRALRRV